MQPQQVFEIANVAALVGWLVLLFFPVRKWTDTLVIGVVVLLLCLVYAWTILSSFHASDLQRFGSLQGVQTLFQNPVVLVAGWVHYLAFDLFVGTFIKNDAAINGISHLAIVPCLLFTFMLGPVGLLLYWMVRFMKRTASVHPKTIKP